MHITYVLRKVLIDLFVYLRGSLLSHYLPLPPPSFPLFFRFDYASRQMVPVCWLFSIHFLSSQTATPPPSTALPPSLWPLPLSLFSLLLLLKRLLCYVAGNNLLLPSCSEVTSCPWLDRAKSYHTIVFELATPPTPRPPPIHAHTCSHTHTHKAHPVPHQPHPSSYPLSLSHCRGFGDPVWGDNNGGL